MKHTNYLTYLSFLNSQIIVGINVQYNTMDLSSKNMNLREVQ